MDFNNNERNNQDPNKRKKNKTNLLICLMAALFAIGLIFFLKYGKGNHVYKIY